MKLFTVGDSISQGFMSLAAARTDLLYSTLIARAMGLKLGEEYSCPEWFGAHSDAVPRAPRCPRNRVQPTTLLPQPPECYEQARWRLPVPESLAAQRVQPNHAGLGY
jgi:hypothetical protein